MLCKNIEDIAKGNLIHNIINQIMKEIENHTLIYQNEEQFQFDLAWRISEKIDKTSGIEVLLEYFSMTDKNKKISSKSRLKKFFTDIIILDGEGNYIPIELKYKKYGIKTEISKNGKKIIKELGHDGASDLGKFDYLWDIHRIEQLKENDSTKIKKDNLLENFVCGYAIMITNDKSYWTIGNNCANEMTLCKKIDKIRWCSTTKKGKPSQSKNITGGNAKTKYFDTLTEYDPNGNSDIDKQYLKLSKQYDFSENSKNIISINNYKYYKLKKDIKQELVFKAFIAVI